MNNQERVSQLHAKMNALQQRRQRRKTGSYGLASLVLAGCLIMVIYMEGASHSGGPAGAYSGAIMFEEAGVYVLLSLVAFMAGVIVTTVLIRRQRRKASQMGSDQDAGPENKGK